MSACMQKRRVGVKPKVDSLMATGNWSTYFPAKMSTEQESCQFVKKLLTTAISCVTYIRSILPEESYANKDLDGIPIKVLRGKATHPIAQALASSLKGVFDALEKKYLKEFLFIIYLNQDDPDNSIHEIYNFSFSYDDGVTSMSDMRNKEQFHNTVYNSTRNLIRSLITLTQSLEPIPDEAYMTIKLTYYEETPADYEPLGFKACDLPQGLVYNNTMVGVNTHHHSLKVRVKFPDTYSEHRTNYTNDGLIADHGGLKVVPSASQSAACGSQDAARGSQVSRGGSPVAPSPTGSQLSCQRAKTGSQGARSGDQQVDVMEVADSVSLLAGQSQLSDISCYCMFSTLLGPIIECADCSSKVHGLCYRIFFNDDKAEGVCVTCSNETSKPCFDQNLPRRIKKYAWAKVQLVAMMRLAVYTLMGLDRIDEASLGEFWLNDVVDYIRKKIIGSSVSEDDSESGWAMNAERMRNLCNLVPTSFGRVDVNRLLEVRQEETGVYISVLEEGGGLVEEEGRGEKEKRSAKTREDSKEVHQAIASGDKNEEGTEEEKVRKRGSEEEEWAPAQSQKARKRGSVEEEEEEWVPAQAKRGKRAGGKRKKETAETSSKLSSGRGSKASAKSLRKI